MREILWTIVTGRHMWVDKVQSMKRRETVMMRQLVRQSIEKGTEQYKSFKLILLNLGIFKLHKLHFLAFPNQNVFFFFENSGNDTLGGSCLGNAAFHIGIYTILFSFYFLVFIKTAFLSISFMRNYSIWQCFIWLFQGSKAWKY